MENMVNHNFWSQKKVFITGHTGFKGAWLSLWLHTLGAECLGYSLPASTSPNLYQELKLAKHMPGVQGDIRHIDNMKEVLVKFQPDIIFHLAAQALVPESYINPVDTYHTNVMGTLNLLECLRKVPSVKSVVIITSDKCYENKEWIWPYRENEALGGLDPYSSSKACAELVTLSYARSFLAHLGLATARAGNVMGGGDWASGRLMPDIMRMAYEKKTLNLRKPNAIRPWQFVLEPLRGYLLLAEHCFNQRNFCGAWNFGPDERTIISVDEILQKMNVQPKSDLKLMGNQHQIHEANFLRIDSTKSRSELNWMTYLNINEIIDWTQGWYEAYYHKKNMYQYSLEQLKEYNLKVKQGCQNDAIPNKPLSILSYRT